MQKQIQAPGSILSQEILKCVEALKEGRDKAEVAATLMELSAAACTEQTVVNAGLCQLTAVPFNNTLVVQAFSKDGVLVNSIDVSYNINMGCFVAKPSATGKGM